MLCDSCPPGAEHRLPASAWQSWQTWRSSGCRPPWGNGALRRGPSIQGGPGPSFLSAHRRPGACYSWRGVPSGPRNRGRLGNSNSSCLSARSPGGWLCPQDCFLSLALVWGPPCVPPWSAPCVPVSPVPLLPRPRLTLSSPLKALSPNSVIF